MIFDETLLWIALKALLFASWWETHWGYVLGFCLGVPCGWYLWTHIRKHTK